MRLLETRKNPPRKHPCPERHVLISYEIYQLLCHAESLTGYKQEIWEITDAAVREYLARHLPESFGKTDRSGYQWKHVFLPAGTALRTVFNKKNFHATVEGDEIHFEGSAVSPSEFANAMGGARRNAWRTVWVLLPDQFSWKLAATLRPAK
jgi:hypothetical protein